MIPTNRRERRGSEEFKKARRFEKTDTVRARQDRATLEPEEFARRRWEQSFYFMRHISGLCDDQIKKRIRATHGGKKAIEIALRWFVEWCEGEKDAG